MKHRQPLRLTGRDVCAKVLRTTQPPEFFRMPQGRDKILHTYCRHILSVAQELIETKNVKDRDALLREMAWLLESAYRLAEDLKSRKLSEILKALRK